MVIIPGILPSYDVSKNCLLPNRFYVELSLFNWLGSQNDAKTGSILGNLLQNKKILSEKLYRIIQFITIFVPLTPRHLNSSEKDVPLLTLSPLYLLYHVTRHRRNFITGSSDFPKESPWLSDRGPPPIDPSHNRADKNL